MVSKNPNDVFQGKFKGSDDKRIHRIFLDSSEAINVGGGTLNDTILQWTVTLPNAIKNGKLYIENFYYATDATGTGLPGLLKVSLHSPSTQNSYDSSKQGSNNIIGLVPTSIGSTVRNGNPNFPIKTYLPSYINPNFDIQIRFERLYTLANHTRYTFLLCIEEDDD